MRRPPGSKAAARRRRQRRAATLLASDAFAGALSAGLTVLLGIAMLHWLLEPEVRTPARPRAAIEVVFLTPSPSPAPSATPSVEAEQAPGSPSASALIAAAPVTPAPHESSRTAPRLDYGALLGDTHPISFAERLPGQRDAYRTPFESRPERFRMRRQITPEDVVRGFAQLVGLWPPGYTDSPCPAIRGLIETTPEVPSQRERALLQDAVLAREQFCS